MSNKNLCFMTGCNSEPEFFFLNENQTKLSVCIEHRDHLIVNDSYMYSDFWVIDIRKFINCPNCKIPLEFIESDYWCDKCGYDSYGNGNTIGDQLKNKWQGLHE